MCFHAEPAHLRFEAPAVRLTLLSDQIRMGDADDDITRRRVLGDHAGEGLEREFIALSWAQQAEAQDDPAAGHAQRGLHRLRIDERQIRDAVRDDVEAARVHSVRTGQPGRRGPGHHDGCVAAGHQLRKHRALPR